MVERRLVLYSLVIFLCTIHVFYAVEKDVIFVLDKSGSISQTDFNIGIDFLKDTVSALTIGTGDVQVSVVSFSDTYNEEFDLDDHTSQTALLNALEGLKTSITTNGGTFTSDALNYVQSTSFTNAKGVRSDADPIVIVMTDGLSQNAANTLTAANLIRSSITNSIIYAIGIGSDLSSTTEELQHIASEPDTDNVMYVTSFLYICNLVPTLVQKIDSSVSASVSSGCTQTTTTVFVGKGGGVVTTTATSTTTAIPTTTTTTSTTPTTTPTTTTATTTTTPTTTTTTPTTTTTTTTTTPTTTTTTPTTTTTTTTTNTASTTTSSQTNVEESPSSSSSEEDNTALIAGSAAVAGVAVVMISVLILALHKRYKNRVIDISSSNK